MDKVYFVRVKETVHKQIVTLAQHDDRSITYMANKVLEAGLAAIEESPLDNARPLTPTEKVEVDEAIDLLKAGKTKLEFSPSWDEQLATPVTVMGTPADTWVTQDVQEQEELAEIEAAVENGTAVDELTPERKAALEKTAQAYTKAKAKLRAAVDKQKIVTDPFGLNANPNSRMEKPCCKQEKPCQHWYFNDILDVYLNTLSGREKTVEA